MKIQKSKQEKELEKIKKVAKKILKEHKHAFDELSK